MRDLSRFDRTAVFVMSLAIAALSFDARAEGNGASREPAASRQADSGQKLKDKPKLDRSGRRRVGVASFYAETFAGRTMADGTPMAPHGNNAASKTLPLGTTARVTSLETGRSAVVTIQDRGPYVKGRIVDLSPSTAQKIGIDRERGVARVEVAPIAVPPPTAASNAATGRRSALR